MCKKCSFKVFQHVLNVIQKFVVPAAQKSLWIEDGKQPHITSIWSHLQFAILEVLARLKCRFLKPVWCMSIMSAFSISTVCADGPSTWTGEYSADMEQSSNWTNSVPYGEDAIFNGNGDNSPLSNRDGGITFSQMQFTASTDISVITEIESTATEGVTIIPSVTATFDIYEHQPLSYPPARVNISNGPAGQGGGTVVYNLEAYGQLYAYAGSPDTTIINVVMTGGNNYFEVNGSGTNIFDNVNSSATTDQIVIVSGSNLTVRGVSTNTVEGVISGSGSLTKTGTGKLILNNANTYTGATLISQGILQVDGSLVSNITVGSSGSLKGTGAITGNLTVAGNISPGNSIGTLNVANYVSTSSSVFSCEINSAGASDKIIATGTMTLAGSLEVIPLDLNFTSPQTYQIMQAAGGVTGTFSSVDTATDALMALSYTTTSVSLSYVPLSVIGLHDNAAAVANCFISLTGTDANTVSGQLLTLSFSDMQQAFNAMQPSQFSGQTWTQFSNALLVASTYSNHFREFSLLENCFDQYRYNVWVDGIGQWQQQSGKNEQFGYHDWTGGVCIGADTSYQQFRLGGAVSYTYSDIKWDQSAGKGRINSYYGGLYGGWGNDIGYIMLSTLGAYNHYNTSRALSIKNIQRNADGSHNGWEVLAGLEAGAYAKMQSLKIGPVARFDYIYLWQQGYQENGANSLNLLVDSRQDQLIQSQAGLVCTYHYVCNPEREHGTIIPRLELSYINQTPLHRTPYVASFENSSCEFNVTGWNFERNLGAVSVDLTYLSAREKVGLSLQYDGQFGSRYYNQIAQLMLNIKY